MFNAQDWEETQAEEWHATFRVEKIKKTVTLRRYSMQKGLYNVLMNMGLVPATVWRHKALDFSPTARRRTLRRLVENNTASVARDGDGQT